MGHEEYRRARNLARRILTERGVTTLPINIFDLCDKYGILVQEYRSPSKSSGCCFIFDSQPFIFFDERLSTSRSVFVCAHEMGHVLMGHVGAFEGMVDKRVLPKKIKERAAMIFAAELLAPKDVLIERGTVSVNAVMGLCGVPYKVAFYTVKEIERKNYAGISERSLR